MKIAFCGIGQYGFSLLKHLDHKDMQDTTIVAYDYNKDIIRALTESGQHPYFSKKIKLSKRVSFTNNPALLVQDCDILVLGVSSDATRAALGTLKDHLPKKVIVVNTSKALDLKTGMRLSEVVAEELAGHGFNYASLAGGTIAKDLFEHEPLGIDVASNDTATLKTLKDVFESTNLSVYTTHDLIGVEYAGAFKNIVSILAGVVKGLGFSYGSETHIISRTAHEIATICVKKFHARPETFSMGSQCWGNDLWMSCTGNTRNRAFGILLGMGIPAQTAIKQMSKDHKTIEGVNTLRIIKQLPELREVEAVNLLYKLIVDKSATVNNIRDYLLQPIS